jgi:hypothetical protein
MVRAEILDPPTLVVLDSCSGADSDGMCPRPGPDGRPRCAGTLLEAVDESVEWALQMYVGSNATKCPLRGFVVESATFGA